MGLWKRNLQRVYRIIKAINLRSRVKFRFMQGGNGIDQKIELK